MPEEKKPKKKSGCLTILIIIAVIFGLAIFSYMLPRFGVNSVRKAIQPGMTVDQVFEILDRKGTCYCFIEEADGWKNVTREEFLKTMKSAPEERDIRGMVSMTFFSTVDRVSISVIFGPDGKVKEVAKPHVSGPDRLEGRSKGR
jgi:hypothetical protein